MSAWQGKYVIGLTGNIATGKSVVRRMLEHLGAYGIDADALAHRAITKGAPAYQPVLQLFGKWILGADGQIDRHRLARIVFADPAALAALEAIVHPLVTQGIHILISHSLQAVIVIEAIKLLESNLGSACDTIWVTQAPEDIQLSRLMQGRSTSKEEALQRLRVQPPPEQKQTSAQVVINTSGSIESTWHQVVRAWRKLVPISGAKPVPAAAPLKGTLTVERAQPRHAAEIAAFINRVDSSQSTLTRADIMAAFGEKAYLLLRRGQQIVGLVGWQVENLVARTANIHLLPGLANAETLQLLMKEVESASNQLQCEALLVFLQPDLANMSQIWDQLGYQARTIQSLVVRAWQEAALESMPSGTVLLFKQLRQDRVLQPI